ncbi:MAG: hypothetical protein IBJ07_10350 [Rhizobiaceae bacterium]|nr:hypothetical protein [Rhizobiaceae bacterium]
MTWRAVPFTLLFLALLGYAGLPSVPANGLHIAAGLSEELKADPAPPHKFSAPQQEQEYRERDVDIVAGPVGFDGDTALPALLPVLERATISPARAPPPAAGAVDIVRHTAHARAPPASTPV